MQKFKTQNVRTFPFKLLFYQLLFFNLKFYKHANNLCKQKWKF